MKEQEIARALGWFSIGLGLAELLAPQQMAKAVGVKNHHTLLRLYGARELAAGISILTQEDREPWIWARVAGDGMDLATLGAWCFERGANRNRLAMATAAVAGVTALDIYCAMKMRQRHDLEPVRKQKKDPHHVTRVIRINRPARELYDFWHNFRNLPRFMERLVSVDTADDGRRSRWVFKAAGNTTMEWDAEIINDHPGELIAWRTLPGARMPHAGTVRFENCPSGRGAVVKLEVKYESCAGAIGSWLAKLAGHSPEQQLSRDLLRFKQLIETGEITTTEGQPSGRRSSLSHRYDTVLKNLASV